MNKLCYYAHPMSTYNSIIEAEDIELLEKLGFIVVNPNKESIQNGMNKFKLENPGANIMNYFGDIVQKCDVLAFRAAPGGKIVSGCAFEIEVATTKNIPVIELPTDLVSRFMSHLESKLYLKQIGHYKP